MEELSSHCFMTDDKNNYSLITVTCFVKSDNCMSSSTGNLEAREYNG
jgi:hypothetical protein